MIDGVTDLSTFAIRERAQAILFEIAESDDADNFDRIGAANCILMDEVDHQRIAHDSLNEENKRRLDEAEKLAAELKTELEKMQS